MWLSTTSELAGTASDIIEDALGEPTPVPEPTPPEPEPEPEPEPPLDTRTHFEKTYTPSADTQVIYVSSSQGDDSNSGLSQDEPVKTVAKGISLLRNGEPDWLLFRRGDLWKGETLGNWELSGKSPDEPMIIGSYGPGGLVRPQFNTEDKAGLNSFPRGNPPRPPLNADNLVFAGLHFFAGDRVVTSPDFSSFTKPVGFRFLRGTSSLTIDDCKFEHYHSNMVLQTYLGSKLNNVSVINSQFFDAYSHSPSDGHSQGIYADGVDALTIKNCIFDKNGWSDQVATSEATIYNHNIYIQKTCTNVSISDNIISRASSHGCQIRPGGVFLNNFLYRNPIGLLVGYTHTNNTAADVLQNVILEGTKITDALPRSWGIEFKGMNPPNVSLSRNIVANRLDDSPNARGIVHKSSVKYAGNIVWNWPPTNPLTSSGPFNNPAASIGDLGYTPETFYFKMREHSADNDVLRSTPFVVHFMNAFAEA